MTDEPTAARPTPRRPGATLADVAGAVGVSARTVSRVVNGQGGYSDETRDLVEQAIARLGYRPNMMARGLLTRSSNTVGLVGVWMTDPFFTDLADGVQRAANKVGKTMFFASTDDSAERQRQVLDALRGHGVDGVVVFPVAGAADQIVDLAAAGVPVVVVNNQIDAPGVGVLETDLRGGAKMAVQHLVRSGRRRIAMATDQFTVVRQRDPRRQGGYREALLEAGLPYDPAMVVPEANSIEGGHAAAHRLLALPERPDAVFAYNDLMAIGVVQAVIAAGLRVPEDIAVIGFDDIAMCEAVTPRLTSVRIDREQLGITAVDFLWRIAAAPDEVHPPVMLPVELILRESA